MSTELVSAIGSCAAAGAAVVAVWVAIRQQTENHRRGLLRDRLQEVTALLVAFEDVARHVRASMRAIWEEVEGAPSEVGPDDSESDQARAQFAARLYASAEPLPINRGTAFGHWPYGSVDPQEQKHLTTAPKLGDPEQDDDMMMWQRGELVEAITRLRAALDRTTIRRRDMPPTHSHQ